MIIVGIGKIFGPDQVLHYVKGCYPGRECACVHVLGSGSEHLDWYLLSEIVRQEGSGEIRIGSFLASGLMS